MPTFPSLYGPNLHAPRFLHIIVTLAIALVTAVAALIGSARAQSFGSSYTSTAEKDCHITNTGALL